MKLPQPKFGFYELLIMAGIAGVLTAVAVPAYQDFSVPSSTPEPAHAMNIPAAVSYVSVKVSHVASYHNRYVVRIPPAGGTSIQTP
jgi:Tfp pilus assembly major pilin PilA